MVCEKCEKKLQKLATPDAWEQKERNSQNQQQTQQQPIKKKVANNMVLPNFMKSKFDPYGNKCQECKKKSISKDEKYCQTCAYTKGVCKMCGTKILDTKFYRQSNV